MIITLNGDRTDVPEGTSLDGLLVRSGRHGAHHRGVAIAMNGEVVPRSLWKQRVVADGDLVELLTATQGG